MSDSPEITMYRTRSCPFCLMAAELLEQLGVEFEEVYLDDHPDRASVTSGILPGHRTVPLVVVGDHPIGGFDDLRRLQGQGRLESVLRGD